METFRLPHSHGIHPDIQPMQQQLMETERFHNAAELFKALSDPVRLRLFWLLCHREECIINLAALLQISSPAVSHHIRPLKESGLITGRREGKEVYYKAADTQVCQLLHPITEQVMEMACPVSTAGTDPSAAETARRVHDYLVENLDKRITIEAVSKKFLVNPTTLKQAFKAEYGMSVAAHLKEHRMEAAARLLRGRDSIAAIARAVGFESQSKFTAAFKAYYGKTPTAYRK